MDENEQDSQKDLLDVIKSWNIMMMIAIVVVHGMKRHSLVPVRASGVLAAFVFGRHLIEINTLAEGNIYNVPICR